MRISFLGTCAGCEPMPDRHHSACAIEHDGRVFFIDAGETCSYTAHLLGIDLLQTRAVFITHPHMDHVGGLANLLWTIEKLGGRADSATRSRAVEHVDVFIPDLEVWEGVLQVLGTTRFRPHCSFQALPPADGEIFREGDLTVQARHNEHMGIPGAGEPWQSFSYMVQAGARRVLFSGDIRHVSELDPMLAQADLILVETGHHRVEDICTHMAERNVPWLGFMHHGRAILADAEAELAKAQAIMGERVFFAADGLQLAEDDVADHTVGRQA